MEIIEYNEEEETLSIRYNTKLIWRYSNINKETYDRVLFFNGDSDKIVKKVLRKKLTVGTNKEVKS